MKSSIYEGTIRHRRFRPRANVFQYRLFFMYLDLAELPELFELHPLWSLERLNVATFRRRDHFGDPAIPLDQAVRDLVQTHTGCRPQGPIRLLTHLRYFGYCFNPASFYYCFDPADTRVETQVLEIHNTPWLERHCYVLDQARNEHPFENWRRYRLDKVFHVSPFIDMNIRYDMRLSIPGETLGVHIIDCHEGEKLFDATLRLRRRALSRHALSRALIKYPALTLKVSAMIYWQALRLTLKGAPFFTHPGKLDLNP
ncbi:MAG: DUF1365 domain-containing protein [Desulfobacterales bacterium]